MPTKNISVCIQNKEWVSVQRILSKEKVNGIAEHSDNNGNLIIHQTLQYHAPDNLIELLIALNPNAIYHQNNQMRLPIHLASFHGVSSRIMKILIRSYPKSLDIKDKKGCTPRDLAFLQKENNGGEWKLHPKTLHDLFKPVDYWINVNLEDTLREKETLTKELDEKSKYIEKLEYQVKKKEEAWKQTKVFLKEFVNENDSWRRESEKHIEDLIEKNNDLIYRLNNSEFKLNQHLNKQDFESPVLEASDSNTTTIVGDYDIDLYAICDSRDKENVITPTKEEIKDTDFREYNMIECEGIRALERRIEKLENSIFFT